MEITEVRIKLVMNPSERLRAFCSITLNGDFVIRDLKIIEGVNGVFVAMPSRKLADRCPRCGCKNHLRAKYCNECGLHLKENRAPKDNQGRAKLHADIAHPINAGCRERIQKAVVEAFEAELERSKLPGYKPQSFDDFDDYDSDLPMSHEADSRESTVPPTETTEGAPVSRDAFSDYDSLIADLKRDAADRRGPETASVSANSSIHRLPPSEGESPVGKPAYRRPVPKPAETQAVAKPATTESTGAPSDNEDRFGAGLV